VGNATEIELNGKFRRPSDGVSLRLIQCSVRFLFITYVIGYLPKLEKSKVGTGAYAAPLFTFLKPAV
jgi:hypothetical protein